MFSRVEDGILPRPSKKVCGSDAFAESGRTAFSAPAHILMVILRVTDLYGSARDALSSCRL